MAHHHSILTLMGSYGGAMPDTFDDPTLRAFVAEVTQCASAGAFKLT